jgi:hypothetical protein
MILNETLDASIEAQIKLECEVQYWISGHFKSKFQRTPQRSQFYTKRQQHHEALCPTSYDKREEIDRIKGYPLTVE